jgi:hypothetical protein
MNTLRGWLLRLGGFFGGDLREQDLAAEMESHLQLHIDENLRAGIASAARGDRRSGRWQRR